MAPRNREMQEGTCSGTAMRPPPSVSGTVGRPAASAPLTGRASEATVPTRVGRRDSITQPVR